MHGQSITGYTFVTQDPPDYLSLESEIPAFINDSEDEIEVLWLRCSNCMSLGMRLRCGVLHGNVESHMSHTRASADRDRPPRYRYSAGCVG